MQPLSRLDSRFRLVFHTLGLSCLGGAIFLQALVFADIATRGYFMAIERNPGILALEIVLTAFAMAYFIYTYQRFIRSIKR